MKRILACLALSAGLIAPAAADPKLAADVSRDYKTNLEPLFRYFHANPELSFMETKTAARMAAELRKLGGLEVTEHVGGTGVVAVLRNGAGPTVLIRADMDGLPLEERSGLPYASTVRQVDREGVEQPVMHACGHDTHITAMVGTARQLLSRKSQWRGTVVFVVQPAEERLGGARAMLKDGLYTRFPKPDYAIAFHAASGLEAGRIIIAPKLAMASADTVDIKVRGVGAHGATPQLSLDPVVEAAQIVMALQTLVSRNVAPGERAVVTVGAINGGNKHNIIPEEVSLQLTLRADTPEIRKKLLDGVRRIAENTARAMGAPEALLPVVAIHNGETVPPTINDTETARRLGMALSAELGASRVGEPPPGGGGSMAADDFAFLAAPEQPGVRGVYMRVGGTPKDELSGPPHPHHSPIFKIAPEPVITTGVQALTVAVLELLKK